jgi:transposase-like protein
MEDAMRKITFGSLASLPLYVRRLLRSVHLLLPSTTAKMIRKRWESDSHRCPAISRKVQNSGRESTGCPSLGSVTLPLGPARVNGRKIASTNSSREAISKTENAGSCCRRRISPETKACIVLELLSSKSEAAALCKKHKISESNYYRWRKTFVMAGVEALRRQPQSRNHELSRLSKKDMETAASVEAAKEELRRGIEALFLAMA